MLKRYKVIVSEYGSVVIYVDATNVEDAELIARRKYNEGRLRFSDPRFDVGPIERVV